MVALVPASGFTAQALADSLGAEHAGDPIRADHIIGDGDPFAALAALEDLANSEESKLPAYFLDEMGLPLGAHDVRVSPDESVVGFVMDGPQEEVLEQVEEHMAHMGWSEVALGELDGATFVKEEGTCTWTLATCTESGGLTGVVFRSVIE